MRSLGFDVGTVRAVSWDVDGTLYSSRQVASLFWTTATKESLRGNLRATWGAVLEMGRFRRQVERARRNGGRIEPDSARAALERRWISPLIESVGPRAGVASVLDLFRNRSKVQVALSDFESDHKLASLGLSHYFDSVYSGERIGYLKPSPEPFRKVLRDLDLPPCELLHVGDRPDTDGAGAAAAGCQVLVLGRDFRSFPELLKILTAS
ncbi:MAG: HAD family hydrolase [Bryobacterales bacterium]|nr:HAD family hydrolase [Bryobacterales bacterium]